MSILEAFILGLIQGLTEFLPVSSSGHIELGKAILGVDVKEDVTFTIVVHGATVLSTIVYFHKYLWTLIVDALSFKWNSSTQYIAKIAVSMIPVGIIGVFFKDHVEAVFDGNVQFVGMMLFVTAALLAITYFAKNQNKEISFLNALIIGVAQSIAVLPGISRSGATIATGLMLGNKKEEITKFSFLMVLLPIIGANIIDIGSGTAEGVEYFPLMVGFVTAFLSGLLACKWMISIVKKGKLIYFAGYCSIVGAIAVLA